MPATDDTLTIAPPARRRLGAADADRVEIKRTGSASRAAVMNA
jgi:hypothetical protein